MGKKWPNYPNAEIADGDDPTFSPQKSQNTLLGTERGTDSSRRIETDENNNLYVRIAQDDTGAGLTVSVLATGAITDVPATTLSTIATFTAVGARKISRVSCSGTNYAKFELVLNTTTIETKRTGPDRNIDFLFEDPLNLADSDILDVKVTHYVAGELNNFEATVYGG